MIDSSNEKLWNIFQLHYEIKIFKIYILIE